MRYFGNYYNYKTGNPECKDLIERITDRFGLNVGLDNQQKVYLVDDNYVSTKVSALMKIEGQVRLTVKVGLLSGLREEERSSTCTRQKFATTLEDAIVTNCMLLTRKMEFLS